MAKQYQVEIITPSPRVKEFRPVFDEFSEEEKPCYDRMVEQFNRTQESPWQARIVEVEQPKSESALGAGGRVIVFDEDERQ